MSNGKYSRRKSGKAIVALVALVMILAIGIGGTLAYLADAKQVTNTFVVGDIGVLKLEEKETTSKVEGNYLIVPGVNITKDPKVSYTPDAQDGEVNVPVYVFVEVIGGGWTKSGSNIYQVLNNTTPVMSWTVASDWTQVPGDGNANVYYMGLDAGKTLGETSVIKDNTITVAGEGITKDNIATIAASANNLSFKAYVIQKNSFSTEVDAWNAVKNTDASSNTPVTPPVVNPENP